jgi:hypothetical protein
MNKKSDVTEQDVASALKKGPKSNKEIRAALSLDTGKYDQRLDRELQRLRKTGKLKLLNGRWTLATTAECPTCGGKGWVSNASTK